MQSRRFRPSSPLSLLLSLVLPLAAACSSAATQVDEIGAVDLAATPGVPAPTDPAPPPSLKTVAVPKPDNLGEFVRDPQLAVVLGKALFWDMQIGSDGVTACASCHFHAGADNRAKNQVSPGMLRINADGTPSPDLAFELAKPNASLKASDFPTRKLENPDDRSSKVLRDTNDIVGSQGVTKQAFKDTDPGVAQDQTKHVKDDVFQVAGVNVRQVEPRHTPTVVNAVFNHRNFWDGRAQNTFNGINHLGDRDQGAKVLKVGANGVPQAVHITLKNSALASQAVAPPLSTLEMSAAGRTFPDIGEKLSAGGDHGNGKSEGRGNGCNASVRDEDHVKKSMALRPLGQQLVSKDDSVLGALSRAPHKGLEAASYQELIEQVFKPEWWKSEKVIEVDGQGNVSVRAKASGGKGTRAFSVLEYNFSLFFGLAVQAYEATLVADDTPFDRFREGNASALTEQQKFGLDLFRSQARGRCINCHGGAEFTDASVAKVTANPLRRREGNIIDRGFNNIGLRTTLEDLAVGNKDPFGESFSTAALAFEGKFFDPSLSPPINSTDTLGSDGAVKVPGLRNVELTAPYFRNGMALTLREVVEFYSRGGDFVPIHALAGNVISPLSTPRFNEEEKEALVAFLLSLTDERVRHERAPFDHPQLFVPDGHLGTDQWVTGKKHEAATDVFREIPAIGKNGGAPPKNFLE